MTKNAISIGSPDFQKFIFESDCQNYSMSIHPINQFNERWTENFSLPLLLLPFLFITLPRNRSEQAVLFECFSLPNVFSSEAGSRESIVFDKEEKNDIKYTLSLIWKCMKTQRL